MRKSRNKKSRPSLSQKARLRKKAQRRRDIERLEERQMLSVNPTDDPLFQDQWHLLATGQLTEQPTSPTFLQSQATLDINVTGAWDLGYTGAGVQVAVVDGGFDLNHPDLNFTFLSELGSNLDILDLDDIPSYIDTGDAHGTAVAGLIGALDNTEGGIGVAPGVDLIPIRAIQDGVNAPVGGATALQFAQLEFLQFAGVPSPGDDGSNADQIIDVWNRSYGPSDATRASGPLNAAELDALRVAATLGRGTWLDIDGDGVFEVEEIRSLGAINVHAAGNGSGADFIDPFQSPTNNYDSAQYDQLANSRYTIAVGSVDFGGNYTNPETGTRGSFAETGTNVLLVAPSQTAGIGIGTDVNLIGGLTTTDLTGNNGEDGDNQSPIFGQEVDGDFQPDTNYTSTFGGTSGAAPQVTGVIALMLEANPNLSYRDVQQILLMSAEQIDQFDESWIVNSLQYYEDAFVVPQYQYTFIDGNQRIVQNGGFNLPLPDPDIPNPQTIYTDPNFLGDELLQGFITQQSYLDEEGNERFYIGDLPIFPTSAVDVSTFEEYADFFGDGNGNGEPLLVFGVGSADVPLGAFGLLENPISGQNRGISNRTTSTLALNNPLVNNELKFENGAGFTVSWGYGDYLEEYGYAHGALNAELAVQLAEHWDTYNLHLDNEVTLTTSVEGAGGVPNRIQPKLEFDIPGTPLQFEVPGGVSQGDINEAFYTEFLEPITFEDISGTDADGNSAAVGGVITSAPFFNDPDFDDWELGSLKGDSRLRIPIDTSVTTDFLSVEWLEFTTQLVGGDIDELRISVLSPDGTQSELSPFRPPIDDGTEFYQRPQSQQGNQLPSFETLNENFGGASVIANDGTTAFIDGQEDIEVGFIDLEDPLNAGDTWTWTTNRHWGELFSVEAQNEDVDGAAVDGQWWLVFENWGDAPVLLGGQYEVALHGTEATGNRIQGKIGIDDNAQGREDQDNDEVFNFDRYVTFGTLTNIQNGDTPIASNVQVVLDDATDSVHYNNNYYETVDDTTGEVFRYPVVDMLEYLALAEINKGALGADLFSLDVVSMATNTYTSAYTAAEVQEWYQVYGEKLGFDPNPVTDEVGPDGSPLLDPDGESILSEADILFWQAQLTEMIAEDIAAAETFEPQLNLGIDPSTAIITAATDSASFAFTYQNYDFNQETFAQNIIVQATQYVVNYDASGNAAPRQATGVVDYAVTGADGNYWFDVEANPEPPVLEDFVSQAAFDAAYAQWLGDYGKVYEYEISLVGDANFQDRIIDRDYSSEVNFLREASGFSSSEFVIQYGAGSIDYQATELKYNVPIFASPDIINGQTTVLKDVNFLLSPDPALTSANVTGSVYRDQDGDNNFDSTEPGITGAVVYYDADSNGTFDAGEISAAVDSDGNYSLTIPNISSPQNVTLTVDPSSVPGSLEFLTPSMGTQTVEVSPNVAVDVDFTMQLVGGEPALIQGLVFNDANQDGVLNNGEVGVGLANQVRVYIDINNDGIYDAGSELSTMTLADGTFAIESNQPGNFNVRVDTSTSPLTLTSPANNAINVDVVVGQVVSDLQFGMFDSRSDDFGDLLNYPTLLSENGARHTVRSDVYLGAGVDIDSDGMPTADASGDNAVGIADEDGVVQVSNIVAGSTFELDITASGQGASLNAWIDFNNDGDWDDAGEQIYQDHTLLLDLTNRLTVTAPADVAVGVELAARFRWGPFGLSYDGPANAGEVEDYLLTTSTSVADFSGDGVVDEADYSVWSTNFGSTTNLEADANNDGVVDIADYTVWRNALAAVMSAPAAATAPSASSAAAPTATPVSVEASFAPITASAEDSLQLEASVLMGGAQDESFALEETSVEAPVEEGSVDEALLLIESDEIAEEDAAEFTSLDSDEEDDEEALLEALSSL